MSNVPIMPRRSGGTESRALDPLLTVYTPESPLREPARFLRSMVRDLFASRELAVRLFLRDLSAQFRNSALGYVWVFVPPVIASLPFVYLQSAGVLRAGDTPIPYAAYATIGTIIWQTFVEALNSPLKSAGAARAMLTRIKFPGEAILLAGLLQVGFSVLVRIPLLVVVFLVFGLSPPATAPLFLVGMLAIALTGFMVGVAVTPVGLLYGDVQQGLPVATTFLMLLTPVIYPTPASGLGAFVSGINPLTPLVTTTREWLVLGRATDLAGFVEVSGMTVLLLLLGWIAYRLALPHLIARLGN